MLHSAPDDRRQPGSDVPDRRQHAGVEVIEQVAVQERLRNDATFTAYGHEGDSKLTQVNNRFRNGPSALSRRASSAKVGGGRAVKGPWRRSVRPTTSLK